MPDPTPLAPLADALFPGLDLGDARRDRRFARAEALLKAREAGLTRRARRGIGRTSSVPGKVLEWFAPA